MNEIEEYLDKHVLIEVYLSPKNTLTESRGDILWEEHGIMNNMNQYYDAIINKVKKWYDNTTEEMPSGVVYITRKDFNFETFFDSCDIKVNIKVDNKPAQRSGGYYSGKSGWFGENDYRVIMELDVSGNFMDCIQGLKVSCAHEMTHAYDDYSRRIISKRQKKTPDIFRSSIRGGVYKANEKKKEESSEYFNEIFEMIYYFSKTETNAYIAEAKTEIMKYFQENPPKSSKDIQEAVKHTEVYSILQTFNSGYDTLLKVDSYNHPLYDDIKEKALKTFNETRSHNWAEGVLDPGIKDTPAKNFHEVVKIISRKYRAFEAKAKKQLPKLAYDAFLEYNDPGTDAGVNMGKTNRNQKLYEELQKIIDLMKRI